MRKLLDNFKLFEAPLGNYDVIGDFNQQGSFKNKQDRDNVTNWSMPVKLMKSLSNTTYRINFYFVNLDLEKYRNFAPFKKLKSGEQIDDEQLFALVRENFGGEYTSDNIKTTLGIDIKTDTSGISFALISAGYGGDFNLTPWLIIHRLIHGIEDGYMMPSQRIFPELMHAYSEWDEFFSKNMQYFLTNATMKSNKTKNLIFNDELSTELMTQFLIKGKILVENKDIEHTANLLIDNVFKVCVGKIFAGF